MAASWPSSCREPGGAAQDIVWLVLFGAINLGAGLAMFVTGARLIPAALAALVGTLEPVLGPIWVWLIHDEVPGVRTLIGGAVVFAALFVHILNDWRRRNARDVRAEVLASLRRRGGPHRRGGRRSAIVAAGSARQNGTIGPIEQQALVAAILTVLGDGADGTRPKTEDRPRTCVIVGNVAGPHSRQ